MYDESYIGMKKNFLTVIGLTRLENGHKAFLCKCDCGKTKAYECTHWNKGIVKSCGCMQKELLRETSTKHGHAGGRLYRVWCSMVGRCTYEKSGSYRNYGGRGIKVCDEWKNDFSKFYEWAIENGYDYDAEFGQCTIDRIDPNKGYNPQNCRWVDVKTQSKNKRPSSEWKKRKLITWNIDGVEKSRQEWCEEYGVGLETALYRIKKGMTPLEALTTEKRCEGRPRKETA